MRKSGNTAARVDALTKEEWEVLQAKLDHPVTDMPFSGGRLISNGMAIAQVDYQGRLDSSY